MSKRAIAEFVSHLKSLDVQLLVENQENISSDQMRLRCSAPPGVLTAELQQELAHRKAELISYLRQEPEGGVQSAEAQALKPANEQQSHPFNPFKHWQAKTQPYRSPLPLSFAQQRLWFLYQLAPDNPFYNVPAAIRLQGTLNRAALERSFHEIIRRHATLRTTFTTLNGQPVQVIAPDVNFELAIVNLQTVAASDRERICQQLSRAEAQRPFNLTTDLPLRVTLLQLDSTEAILLLTLHHIVTDGWSLGVLIRELASFYTAFVTGQRPELPALPIQYADFAGWQRDWLQGDVLEAQLAYWRRQLHNLPALHLPTDRPRSSAQTYQGSTYPLQISPGLTQQLAALSQQTGVSLFMTLLAAFQALLYRYTGQEDIAVGAPIANRHRTEIEGLIGFFVNSLVMRVDLSGNPSFYELLKRVQNVALEAYEHQDIPFEKLVEALDPDRDLSRNPLFQIAFALQNAPMQPLKLPGLMLQPAPLESSSTRFDLEVHLWEPAHGLSSLWQSQEGLSGFIAYSTDLFDRDSISRLVGHFQTLLEGVAANSDTPLSDLPLLTVAERQQILVEWNRIPEAKTCPDQPLGFHHLFEAWVQSAPEAIALVSESGSLTYQDLNQQADRLAQVLQQMGVRSNALVGLCVDRSADMVIGILGILKAGGAYVPLDPNYPSDRLHFMLSDTQVPILLTQSWLVEKLPASQAQILCLDQCPTDPGFPTLEESGRIPSNYSPDAYSDKKAPISPDADRLAYVIYTSGSTGIPKGVLLSHRGLCNVVAAQRRLLQTSPDSRVLQFSALSFDASIFEIALALGSGSRLYIPPRSAQLPGMALVQFLKDHAITHALLTPAVLAVLPAVELSALQVLITGGEACSSQVVDRWAANRRFFNAYGPTETTIWATVAELCPGDHPLTIGRPILNTQAYILDDHWHPVPVGIPGELYIAGEGLACGYLNRPELTAERFISVELPVPRDETGCCSALNMQHVSLYKTGDRVRYRADGSIEFLGRSDYQVKIRGFRVEPGEIEATLQRHPAIQDAVVIACGEEFQERRLIAYFSLNHQHLQTVVQASLQNQQIQHWQTLYNQTYQPFNQIQSAEDLTRELAAQPDPTETFNITGWNSSYTRAPIPLEQMQAWVNDRVQQILALKPERILEVGCGTGLLLFQLAPHCQKYVATDFSTVALASIDQQLERLNLSQVELLHRVAADFEGIDSASFDVVILNSIVQYFPSVDYLLQVLEGAIQAVAPGGVLFLGDVRSLPLLTAFHVWMQFSQAEAAMERTHLRQQMERSRFEEPELVIDPAFFHALRDRFPQIRQVQIRLSRGHSHNEMTQFRYNVLLHIAHESTHVDQPYFNSFNAAQRYNWQLNPITAAEIQKLLVENKPEIIEITNITNSRVNAAVQVADWLDHQESPKTVGQMREMLQNAAVQAIDPQDWWDLEAVLPYRVEISWSGLAHTGTYHTGAYHTDHNHTGNCPPGDYPPGNYDVLLIRHGAAGAETEALREAVAIDLPGSRQFYQNWTQFTNNPLQSQFARQLIPELRQYLGQTLPDYMVPATFVPLGRLPLNSSGKVNRHALPAPQANVSCSAQPVPEGTIRPALTSTESTLVDIWQELLQLKQVHVHDNFFELGGHSLLATQMTSRVRDAFGLELPLKSVFEAPTIAQLAPILETLRDTLSHPQAPPLVRLDRSAFRHRRSVLPNANHSVSSEQPDPAAAFYNPLCHESFSHEPLPQALPDPALTAARSPLVPLTLGNQKQPFFCVHPMFGVVFPYLELAHQLNSDRSFYGLQPQGLDGKSVPLNRMESIAAYYIKAIQTLQPHGPYFLGGWSFGGLVAFEMAQQLTQAGQQIGLLAILDTPAPCHQPSFYQSLKFLWQTALWSTLPFLLDYGAIAANRFGLRTSWLSHWQWSAIVRQIPEESRLRLMDESAIAPLLQIVYANSQATYRYVPKPYRDRITLFQATEANMTGQDLLAGWKALAADIRLHQVPGNHLSLLKPPHVQTLAQQLQQYLS